MPTKFGMMGPEERANFERRAAQKCAQRRQDWDDIAAGRRTVAEVQRANAAFTPEFVQSTLPKNKYEAIAKEYENEDWGDQWDFERGDITADELARRREKRAGILRKIEHLKAVPC